MTPLTIPPGSPMPVEQFGRNVRLHLTLLLLSIALRIAFIIPAIGIDARNKRNRLSIRRPQFIVGPARKGSDPRSFAARQRDPINLLRAIAPRKKRQLRAIRRPSRSLIAAAVRQLTRLPASRRHDPNIRHPTIRLQIRRRNGIRNITPIRRNLRIANPMHRNQIIKSHRPPLTLRRHRTRPHTQSKPGHSEASKKSQHSSSKKQFRLSPSYNERFCCGGAAETRWEPPAFMRGRSALALRKNTAYSECA